MQGENEKGETPAWTQLDLRVDPVAQVSTELKASRRDELSFVIATSFCSYKSFSKRIKDNLICDQYSSFTLKATVKRFEIFVP